VNVFGQIFIHIALPTNSDCLGNWSLNALVCVCEQELVVALSGFVSQFETQFASIAYQQSEAEKEREYHTVTGTVGVWNSPNGLHVLTAVP